MQLNSNLTVVSFMNNQIAHFYFRKAEQISIKMGKSIMWLEDGRHALLCVLSCSHLRTPLFSVSSFLYGYSYVDGGQEMRWFSRSTWNSGLCMAEAQTVVPKPEVKLRSAECPSREGRSWDRSNAGRTRSCWCWINVRCPLWHSMPSWGSSQMRHCLVRLSS